MVRRELSQDLKQITEEVTTKNFLIKCNKKVQTKRNFRKSSKSRKSWLSSKHSAKQEKALEALAKEFLAHKISAAGVSYVVDSKSKLRRKLWLIAVVVSMSFMGYMTFKVVNEYLRYPKMLFREEEILTNMKFPAVTLCSLNPILNQNIQETSVYKLSKMKQMLQKAKALRSNLEFRDSCYRNLMCKWSWFSEYCTCVSNPCLTEFCLGDNATHCACSPAFCKGTYPSCKADHSLPMNKRRCFCANEDAYKGWKSRPFPDDTSYLDDINDTEVRNVIQLIRGAKTDDLADIEEGLLPTPDDLYDYGVNFDSLIIACSFEQQPCYRENFTVLYHPKYGRCYMFNFLGTGQDSGAPIEIFSYGSTSGLHLTLHITSQQNVDLLSEEIGARIVIHDPYDLPFVAEHGFNVRPHDMSAVEVTLSRIERLGPPWGSCVQDGSYLDFKQNVKPYSILGCQKACRHFYLTKYCGCTLRHFLRGAVLLKSTTNFAFCSVTNDTQNSCMKDVIKRIQGKSIFCNCKPSCSSAVNKVVESLGYFEAGMMKNVQCTLCASNPGPLDYVPNMLPEGMRKNVNELKYSTKVSSSKLNENFYRTVKSIRTLSSGNEGEIKMINASDQNSLVGLKVYYSTFQVGKDSEIASYSWETLVANIGGNLGFFMGLTLITFVEVLEFLWDILCMIFKKLTKLNYYENKVLTFPSSS